MSSSSYHRIIRKTIIAFANLFNNIVLIRENNDGSENERFVVPIAYATKEKYIDRIEGDPEANKKIQLTLPRMSYEMTGFGYDATRKLNTNVKNFALDTNGAALSQFNPVPYNFSFDLHLYTRNIEDSTQIIENILPYFTPDYTIKINMIPEMNIIKEIPIVLNQSTYDIGYEGDFDSDIRSVNWTLSFIVKGYLFGGVTQPKIIKQTTQNLYIEDGLDPSTLSAIMFPGGFGHYHKGEQVYQGISFSNATAIGTVEKWEEELLLLEISDIEGKFTMGEPIKAVDSLSSWKFVNQNEPPHKILSVTTKPKPNTATPNTAYTYDVTTERFDE